MNKHYIPQKTVHKTLLLAFCCSPLILSAYTSGPLDVIESSAGANDGTLTVEEIISFGEKTLGSASWSSYIDTTEIDDTNNVEDLTITYFGGYFSQHRFIWEVDGENPSGPTPIMWLDYQQGLEIHSGADIVSISPSASEIKFSSSNGTVTLINDAGILKVGDGTSTTGI